MNIRNNCRKATYMIEKMQWERITLFQKIELQIHLAGCPQCSIYRAQSIYINQLVTAIFMDTVENRTVLDDAFKNDLEKILRVKIENADDKNSSE